MWKCLRGKNTTLFLSSIAKCGRIQRPSCRHGRPFLPTRHVGLPDKVHHFVRKGVVFRAMKWAYFSEKVHHYCPFSSSLGIGSKTNLLEINALQKWRKKPLLQASSRRTAKFFKEDSKNREKSLQKEGRTIVRPMRFSVCSEEALGKHGEVDAPVAPDVTAAVLVVFVGILHLVEVTA